MESSFQTLKSCLSSSSCTNDDCECINAIDAISFASAKDDSLQKKIWLEEELINPILEYGTRIYESKYDGQRLASLEVESFNIHKAYQADSWVICCVNLIAYNSGARHMLWERLGAFRVCQILMTSPPAIAQKWCYVLNNLLLERDILESFIQNEELEVIIHRLCDLYSFEIETATNEFPLYCLELILFSGGDSIAKCWKSLKVEDGIMCLGIINSLVKGETKRGVIKITPPSIALISSIFKFELEKVLDGNPKDSNKFTSIAIRDACTCINAVAIDDKYKEWLQKDESILPCVLAFLKIMNAATYTQSGGNSSIVWCRKHICSTEAGGNMRTDLVHILANLVLNCPSNQEKLRCSEGLEEIFGSVKKDEHNPLMHQAVILGMSYVLRDEANGKYMRNFLTTTEYDALLEKIKMKPNQYTQMI